MCSEHDNSSCSRVLLQVLLDYRKQRCAHTHQEAEHVSKLIFSPKLAWYVHSIYDTAETYPATHLASVRPRGSFGFSNNLRQYSRFFWPVEQLLRWKMAEDSAD